MASKKTYTIVSHGSGSTFRIVNAKKGQKGALKINIVKGDGEKDGVKGANIYMSRAHKKASPDPTSTLSAQYFDNGKDVFVQMETRNRFVVKLDPNKIPAGKGRGRAIAQQTECIVKEMASVGFDNYTSARYAIQGGKFCEITNESKSGDDADIESVFG